MKHNKIEQRVVPEHQAEKRSQSGAAVHKVVTTAQQQQQQQQKSAESKDK